MKYEWRGKDTGRMAAIGREQLRDRLHGTFANPDRALAYLDREGIIQTQSAFYRAVPEPRPGCRA